LATTSEKREGSPGNHSKKIYCVTYWALKENPLGQERGHCIKSVKGRSEEGQSSADPKEGKHTNYITPFGHDVREKRGVTR